MQQLEPGHLTEDYPIAMFFEDKRFSSVFWKWNNKIQGLSMQMLKSFKGFEFT